MLFPYWLYVSTAFFLISSKFSCSAFSSALSLITFSITNPKALASNMIPPVLKAIALNPAPNPVATALVLPITPVAVAIAVLVPFIASFALLKLVPMLSKIFSFLTFSGISKSFTAPPMMLNIAGRTPTLSINFVTASVISPTISKTSNIASLRNTSPIVIASSVNLVFNWFILASYESIYSACSFKAEPCELYAVVVASTAVSQLFIRARNLDNWLRPAIVTPIFCLCESDKSFQTKAKSDKISVTGLISASPLSPIERIETPTLSRISLDSSIVVILE